MHGPSNFTLIHIIQIVELDLYVLMVCLETTFSGQTQTWAINQFSDGQSKVYKLCLEAQAAHLFL